MKLKLYFMVYFIPNTRKEIDEILNFAQHYSDNQISYCICM